MSIPRGQLSGLLLIAALPLLAAFGVFGSTERTFNAEGGGVLLELSYTERLRYGHPTQLKIHVRAAEPDAALHGVRVRVDTALLDRFDNVESTPHPTRVGAESFEFALPEGADDGVIVFALDPERYGEASGRVTVSTPGSEAAALTVRTFIFP